MEQITCAPETAPEPDQTALAEYACRIPSAWLWRWQNARIGKLLSSFPSRVFLVALAGYLLLSGLHLWLSGAGTIQQQGVGAFDLTNWAEAFTASWRRFDTHFFLDIAHRGYMNQGLAAFFPLYPALIRLVAWPLAGHYTLAALLMAWLCGWGSYLWFYRLVQREFGPRVARLALLALACCPVAFFAFAPYSESLFLLVSFGAVERARAGRLWQAGALAALGMLTRPTGILLLIPLGWGWAPRSPAVRRLAAFSRQRGLGRRFNEIAKRHQPRLEAAPPGKATPEQPLPRLAWLSLGLAPLALLGYMLYLKLVTGNALAFLKGESAWFRHFTLPWDTIGLFAIAFQRAGQAGAPELYAINILDLLLVLPLPALVLYCALRGRLWLGAALYQLALTALLVAVPTYPSGLPYEVLLSTERFMLPAFPIFLLLGQLGLARPRLYRFLLVISLILLIVNTLRFLDGDFIA